MSYGYQIHALVDHVRDFLRGRDVAADVVHGPDPVEHLLPVGRARIHFLEAGDEFEGPMQARASRGVASQIYAEQRSVVALIRCTSTRAGATWRDHTGLAEVLRDEVLRAVRTYHATGLTLCSPRRGEYDPIEPGQVASGAIYRLELTVGAGVYEVAPEAVSDVLAEHLCVLDRS